MANPLDYVIRGFNVVRAQVAQRVCGDADWLRIFGRAQRGEGFGNARYARTIFEQALNAQALRLAGNPNLDADELAGLTAADFDSAAHALGEAPNDRRRRWRRAS